VLSESPSLVRMEWDQKTHQDRADRRQPPVPGTADDGARGAARPTFGLAGMRKSLFQALAIAARRNESVALGLISGAKGSSPQKAGAKALFYLDGRIEGTLGGGCLEAEVQRRAIESLRTGRPASFNLLLDHDFGWDDGLICGGRVEGLIIPEAQKAGESFWTALAERVTALRWGIKENFSIECVPDSSSNLTLLYCETVRPPCSLWIAGAGHVSQAVAPLAQQLDFEVTVFDDRPALVNSARFPAGVVVTTEVWERLLALPHPPGPSFALIATQGHRHDAVVLQNWIHRPFLFLGMIGSTRKARMIFEQFQADQIASVEELARVACPVGVQIRSQTVPEIAISIVAQFIQKRAELVRDPVPL
jgi:xanthine dehydrogenase accessory factor